MSQSLLGSDALAGVAGEKAREQVDTERIASQSRAHLMFQERGSIIRAFTGVQTPTIKSMLKMQVK